MSVGKKVLYVDDEEINLLIFIKKLEKNYQVITAENGEKGLQILKDHSDIDYIVSDLKMPGMSGLEFIEKAQAQFPDKEYYILSGYAMNQEMQDAIDSGLIRDYWMKPANFGKISEALR